MLTASRKSFNTGVIDKINEASRRLLLFFCLSIHRAFSLLLSLPLVGPPAHPSEWRCQQAMCARYSTHSKPDLTNKWNMHSQQIVSYSPGIGLLQKLFHFKTYKQPPMCCGSLLSYKTPSTCYRVPLCLFTSNCTFLLLKWKFIWPLNDKSVLRVYPILL